MNKQEKGRIKKIYIPDLRKSKLKLKILIVETKMEICCQV